MASPLRLLAQSREFPVLVIEEIGFIRNPKSVIGFSNSADIQRISRMLINDETGDTAE